MSILGIIFLISSSGYVLYTSKCSCSGEEKISVFVRPETCETSFHKHHQHNTNGAEQSCSADECHNCKGDHKSCGCDTPSFFFFKLKDTAINEEVKFVMAQVPVLFVASIDIPEDLLQNEADLSEKHLFADPPPKIANTLDFLISIQQLKIPSLA